MTKDEILREIKRTAEANGGTPLGTARLQAETGIRKSDWRKYWARLGDAHLELGLARNRFASETYTETHLIEKYVQYARKLGRLPTEPDICLKRRNDSTFPSADAFKARWSKPALVEKLLEWCRSREGYDDIIGLCEEYLTSHRQAPEETSPREKPDGFVYLVKSGRFYKIGKTNDAGRRGYELAIQLPEKAKQVHVIRTDDPSGIEAYWHKRFEANWKNGEWYELDAADVAAFKRRKFQ